MEKGQLNDLCNLKKCKQKDTNIIPILLISQLSLRVYNLPNIMLWIMTKTYLVFSKLPTHFLADIAWLSRAEKQTIPKQWLKTRTIYLLTTVRVGNLGRASLGRLSLLPVRLT